MSHLMSKRTLNYCYYYYYSLPKSYYKKISSSSSTPTTKHSLPRFSLGLRLSLAHQRWLPTNQKPKKQYRVISAVNKQQFSTVELTPLNFVYSATNMSTPQTSSRESMSARRSATTAARSRFLSAAQLTIWYFVKSAIGMLTVVVLCLLHTIVLLLKGFPVAPPPLIWLPSGVLIWKRRNRSR